MAAFSLYHPLMPRRAVASCLVEETIPALFLAEERILRQALHGMSGPREYLWDLHCSVRSYGWDGDAYWDK